MTKLVLSLLNWLLRDAKDVPGLSPRAKLIALRDAHLNADFVVYKNRRIASNIKQIALRADSRDDVMFLRGMIYADQSELAAMQRAHDQLAKEKEGDVDLKKLLRKVKT